MGIFVISIVYGFFLIPTFPLLKAAVVFFPRRGWILQWIIWVAYEYVKTLGFGGLQYGVTAYTHWRWTLLMQIADVTGVWGLSALIVFVSAWVAQVLAEAQPALRRGIWSAHRLPESAREAGRTILSAARGHRRSAALWVICFAGVLVYGIAVRVDYGDAPKAKVALIQSNSDPWVSSVPGMDEVSAYRNDLRLLVRLSGEALAAAPDTDFVVWPETSFVPRIMWHYRHRQDQRRFALVEELLTYLDAASAPHVLGNDHGVDGWTRLGEWGIIDHNGVVVFKPGQNVIPPTPDVYAKMHLVPFTEYFPFEKLFPGLYQMLLNGDTHLWEPGIMPTVFSVQGAETGVVFGTPVCFEDTFGYLSRSFVNNGASMLVNLSNDAWSKSLVCQYQHLSMAVFRAVENRVSLVRSTATGQTSAVDPNGVVIAMAEPFVPVYLNVAVPVRGAGRGAKRTVYTRWGDYVGILFVSVALGGLFWGVFLSIIRKKDGRDS
jgi:apolipoprotein N-acyltransferase